MSATASVIMVTVSALEPERRTPASGALTATQARRLSVRNWEGSELVSSSKCSVLVRAPTHLNVVWLAVVNEQHGVLPVVGTMHTSVRQAQRQVPLSVNVSHRHANSE